MSLPQSAKSAADNLADKNIDSTDTEIRYAAYGARLRTALRAGQRYLAYVRDSSLFRSTRTRDGHNAPLRSIRLVTSEKLFGPSFLQP
jgi:hypothetical protein